MNDAIGELERKLQKVTAERDEAWRVAAEQTRTERERAEKAEAERDKLRRTLQATDDYRIADWQKLEAERDDAEAERAQLSAVVEQVREEAKAYGDQPEVMEPCGAVAQSLQKILNSAPPVALDRVKAEAWEEGGRDCTESRYPQCGRDHPQT